MEFDPEWKVLLLSDQLTNVGKSIAGVSFKSSSSFTEGIVHYSYACTLLYWMNVEDVYEV